MGEEDDKTTTAKPAAKDAKEGDDAGKGKGTGDKKSILDAIKKKVEEKKADADSSKGSLLEEDDKTTTAKPAAKDAKEGDDAGKGKGTGDKKSILGKLNNAIKRKWKKRKQMRIVRREASWRRMTRRRPPNRRPKTPKRETMRAREKAPATKKASWVS